MALNQITEYLWLGSYTALSAQKQLEANNVTHILSAISADLGDEFVPTGSETGYQRRVKNFTSLRLSLDDVEDENIMQHFDRAIEFIDSAVCNGTGCLVHCMAGVSRSTTIVCAYLMRKNFWNPQQALKYVRGRRPVACPNPAFMDQLNIYYQCGFELSEEKPLYRQYLLKKRSEDAYGIAPEPQYSPLDPSSYQWEAKKCYQVMPKILARLDVDTDHWDKCRFVVEGRVLGLDEPAPLNNPTLTIRQLNSDENNNDNDKEYTLSTSLFTHEQVSDLRCKKCRTLVGTSHQFILHDPQSHSPMQTTRNGMSAGSSLPPQCTSYFIEPVGWMRPELEQGLLEGKLSCPKCSAKLGAYHWQGAKCSCGTWVTPGISIQRGRVDESKRQVRAKA